MIKRKMVSERRDTWEKRGIKKLQFAYHFRTADTEDCMAEEFRKYVRKRV
jgi:hypothetical protein